MPKIADNPLQAAFAAPRCTARSKRTGEPCRAPAVSGWTVCRMHGAGGGAPAGNDNGNFRHGNRTKQAESARLALRWLLLQAKETLARAGG